MGTFAPIILSLFFNLVDLISGIIAAVKNKDIQSSKLRDGMFKKVGFILCYVIAWVIDSYGCLVGFHLDVSTVMIISVYACTTELVSIFENINKINPDILPKKLAEMFHFTIKEYED